MTLYDTLPPQELTEPPLLVVPGTAINAAYAHPAPGQLVAESQDGDQVHIRHTETDEVFTMPVDMFQGQADREREAAEALKRRGALAVGPAAGKAAIIGLNEGAPVSPEDQHTKRMREVFEPLDVYMDKESEPDEDQYDVLLYGSDEELAAHQAEWRAINEAKNKDKIWPVTDETKRDAFSHLLKLVQDPDKQLQGVLDGLGDKIDLNDLYSVVDKIRTDKEVRLAFGTYISDKIDYMIKNAPLQLPTRLFANRGKAPRRKVTNVERPTNREVVALMCLAKIDGTFDQKSVLSTDVGDKHDIDLRGQHNHAADVVLEFRDKNTYDYSEQDQYPW